MNYSADKGVMGKIKFKGLEDGSVLCTDEEKNELVLVPGEQYVFVRSMLTH